MRGQGRVALGADRSRRNPPSFKQRRKGEFIFRVSEKNKEGNPRRGVPFFCVYSNYPRNKSEHSPTRKYSRPWYCRTLDSLFSPLSRSLHPPRAAVTLQARRGFPLKCEVSKEKIEPLVRAPPFTVGEGLAPPAFSMGECFLGGALLPSGRKILI